MMVVFEKEHKKMNKKQARIPLQCHSRRSKFLCKTYYYTLRFDVIRILVFTVFDRNHQFVYFLVIDLPFILSINCELTSLTFSCYLRCVFCVWNEMKNYVQDFLTCNLYWLRAFCGYGRDFKMNPQINWGWLCKLSFLWIYGYVI